MESRKLMRRRPTLMFSITVCVVVAVTKFGNVGGVRSYGARHKVKYIGCMKPADLATDFFMAPNLKSNAAQKNMDVRKCVSACWLYRGRVATMQRGRRCYCAHTLSSVVKVPEEECSYRCKGNCYQNCGGENVLSVYKTGYVSEHAFYISKNALLAAKIGCYDAAVSKPILCYSKFAPLKTKRMTVAMCVFYCDSMYEAQFATLSSPDTCCCSNSVTGARNTHLDWCNIPCSGSQSMGCVGWALGTQWATFQLSRLPSFKRWSKSTFVGANWLEPPFPSGETFSGSRKKRYRGSSDLTLSGLMARKMARGSKNQGWRRQYGVVGWDKRDPAHEKMGSSYVVLDVPKKPARTEGEDKSIVIIIVALVVAFFICTVAFGLYIFSRRRAVQKRNRNINYNRKKSMKSKKKRKKSLKPKVNFSHYSNT